MAPEAVFFSAPQPKALLAGKLIIAAEVARLMLEGSLDPLPSLRRHLADDWGAITEQERHNNIHAIANGGEIFSSYDTATGLKLWIITEWDRSVTTLLLPSEY